MPLIEINQAHQITASVRLDEMNSRPDRSVCRLSAHFSR